MRTLAKALEDEKPDLWERVLCPDGSVKPLGGCGILDIRAAIQELDATWKPKCRCGDPGAPEHECPLQSEIYDDHTLCNCCDDCASNCKDEI